MAGVILALGSVNADFQFRVDRPLEGAETAMARDFRRLGGGKAANAACQARLLGHEAWLFGRVGDDDLKEQALAPLRALGVDISGVSAAAGAGTGVAMVVVPGSGRKHIVVAENANDAWSDGAVEALCRRIAAAPAGSVLVADCEIPGTVAKAAARAARQRGLRVVLDPSFPDRVDAGLLAAVDAITPNASEARSLRGLSGAGSDDLADIARGLAAAGPGLVCIKEEDGGCLLAQARGQHRIPAIEVEVADTTGAGDAFAGALAVALLEGRGPEEAARFAVAASTLAVTAYGAQPSLPRRDAVDALLQRQAAPART